MSKKIIIAVGGSGGHLLPSQVLASTYKGEVLFAGSGLKSNTFFDRSGFNYRDITSSPHLFRGLYKLIKGVGESLKLIKTFNPEKVVGVGSWHSLPVLIAALMLRKPLVLYTADAIPSKVIRLFSPFATWTAVSFFDALRYIKGPSKVVSWPLREAVVKKPTREEALSYYGLDPSKKTVLVFGGSQGAKTLNSIAKEALKRLDAQIIHFCGQEKEVSSLQEHYGKRAVVKAFEPNMGFAWQAADLVVCRSGASTLAEQFHYAVPALYIPYKFVAGQFANALHARAMGAGEILEEHFLTADKLVNALQRLLNDDERYRNAMKNYKAPTSSLAEEVMR